MNAGACLAGRQPHGSDMVCYEQDLEQTFPFLHWCRNAHKGQTAAPSCGH